MQRATFWEKVNMYSNEIATLTHYKSAFKGSVVDYIIRFHSHQSIIEFVTEHSFDIVKKLIDEYQRAGKFISGRLVARVVYTNERTGKEVPYYHASYATEVIENAEDFYFTHMLKIAERMDAFNRVGSHLIIDRIDEIHLHVNVRN